MNTKHRDISDSTTHESDNTTKHRDSLVLIGYSDGVVVGRARPDHEEGQQTEHEHSSQSAVAHVG